MKFPLCAVLVVLLCCASLSAGQNRWPGFGGLKDLITRVRSQIRDNIGSLNQPLENLFNQSPLGNFSESVRDIASCFVSELNGQDLNIMNRSDSFTNIVTKYYTALPNKTISAASIRNLFNSTVDILSRCMDPDKNDTAQYGFTELSDKSPEEVRALMGLQAPDESQLATSPERRRKRLTGSDSACQVSTRGLPSSYDWRSKNVVTGVRDQGSCGSCWTFAALAALESALVRAGRAQQSVDLSEQQLVDCASRSGCNGGNSPQAFEYLKSSGVTSEANARYAARSGRCQRSYSTVARISDYCVRSRFRYTRSSLAENLSDDTIAAALVANGPLYIAVDADPLQNYRGGVLSSSRCTSSVNHAVTLVGFTGNSWIIKNSWGARWGNQGYFELARGRNMCGVNTEIAWPIL